MRCRRFFLKSWIVAAGVIVAASSPAFAQSGACCRPNGQCITTDAASCVTSFGGEFVGGPCSTGLCRGACCRPTGACSDGIPELNCESTGGTFQGLGSICAEQNCPVLPNGACCFAGGTFCQEGVTPSACLQTYLGDGTTCAECPGACCLTDDSCLDTTRGQCTMTEGASFKGHLSVCPPDHVCGMGGCCFATTNPDGECAGPIDPFNCAFSGGMFLGNGSDCTTSTCAPFGGGCCCGGFSCFVTTQDECPASCAFLGEGINCGPASQCPGVGACCGPTGQCIEVDGFSCVQSNGQFRGEGTSCTPNPCGTAPVGACCSNAECAVVTQEVCMNTGVGGQWHPGVACEDICPGTCCLQTPNPHCIFVPENPCIAMGGTFVGEHVTCPSNCQAECANDGDCDDQNACNGLERCVEFVCVPGDAPNCDDGDPCTTDGCISSTGECTHEPAPNGTACAGDGEECTADVCLGGVCDHVNVPELTPCTPDENPCTNDECIDGMCTHFERSCFDDNACTTDTCNQTTGECENTAIECDDGDACTADSCDPATGCVNEPLDCDDGDACTTDSCDPATGCVHEPVDCDDSNLCTTDSCDPGTGCVHTPISCDNDECTTHDCDPHTGCIMTGYICGACCVDNLVFECLDTLEGSCESLSGDFRGVGTRCANLDPPCNGACCIGGAGCGDGFRRADCEALPVGRFMGMGSTCATTPCGACCTLNLGCNDGVLAEECTGSSDAFLQGQVCETAPCGGCCDPETLDCTNGSLESECDGLGHHFLGPGSDCGPIFDPCPGFCQNDEQCQDNDVCNGMEGCVNNECTLGEPLNCLDENECTVNEHCDPVQGCQSDPKNCSDGFACTVDVCVPGTGECLHGASIAACDDSNPCTDDACAPEHPEHGPDGCVHGPVSCDDGVACTDDSCNPATGSCVHTPNDTLCLDEDGCTINERCDPTQGCAFDPKNCADAHDCTTDTCMSPSGECARMPSDTACDDGIGCTVDTCDTTLGCLHGAEDSLCNDNIGCTIDDCQPNNPNTGPDGCVHTPDDGPCVDLDLCTTDTCDPLGGCVHSPRECSDDGTICTVEQCNPENGECEATYNCGACCTDDGAVCLDVPPDQCTGEGLVFLGLNTTCAFNPCRGACCEFGHGCTDDVPADQCDDPFETFMGVGTVCATAPCGACCRKTTSQCTDGDTPENCVNSNSGVFQGNGTRCTESLCDGACCHADGTCTVESGDECLGDFRGPGTACDELNPPCSPFPGGACCLDDGSCADGTTLATCESSLGGSYQGDASACASVTCTATGACCADFFVSSCAQRTEAGCQALGAINGVQTFFLGVGVPCAGQFTPTCPASGACCLPDGTCVVRREQDCAGVYRGDGTACDELEPPCEPFVAGACCLADSTCRDGTTLESCFLGFGGIYQGDHSTCAQTNCTATGACCITPQDGVPQCFQTTETGCESLRRIAEFILQVSAQAQFFGIGVPCEGAAGDECPPPRGACCVLGSGCVPDLTEAQCSGEDRTFMGAGTACNAVPCGACCDEHSSSCGDGYLQSTCEAEQGVFQGPGSFCSSSDCRGACCLADQACVVLEGEDCVGDFRGTGTNCAELNPPCGFFLSGACCVGFDTCINGMARETCFFSIGGDYQGDGVQCSNVECGTIGACCVEDGLCAEVTEVGCSQYEAATGLDTVYLGDGTACGGPGFDECPTKGACCLPGEPPICTELPQSACLQSGGVFLGLGVPCIPDICVCPGGCDDLIDCTIDHCDPASHTCIHVPSNALCDDGVDCTNDECDPAAGCVNTPVDSLCDDMDPCTIDECDPHTDCEHEAVVCDDGIDCTADLCDANGQCQFVPSSALCDDGVACTSDICDPASGCLHAPNDAACEDGDPCTINACDSVLGCQTTGTVVCPDDGNPCTDDVCLPAVGCTTQANTNPCNDGEPCTTNDTCAGGTCVGGPPPNCDDGDACTNDSCQPGVGCVNTFACDDGNPCSQDLCLAPLLGCTHLPVICPDDGDPCTVEVCDSGSGGCISAPTPCDDGDPCTVDACDPTSGCLHQPVPCPHGQRCDADTGACVCPEICGDLDFDDDVDGIDFLLFLRSYLRSQGDPRFNVCADYNHSGTVGLLDLRIWRICRLLFQGAESAGTVGPAPVAAEGSVHP